MIIIIDIQRDGLVHSVPQDAVKVISTEKVQSVSSSVEVFYCFMPGHVTADE